MHWNPACFLSALGILSLVQTTAAAPHSLEFHPGSRLIPLYAPPHVRGDLVDMAFTSSGVMILTNQGEMWEVTGEAMNLWKRFAAGLRAPLGIERIQNHQYLILQPQEVTLVSDLDDDQVADSFKAISSGWPQSGPNNQWIEGPYRDSEERLWMSYLPLADPQPSLRKNLSLSRTSAQAPGQIVFTPTPESQTPRLLFRHYEILNHRILKYLFTIPTTSELFSFSGHHLSQDLTTMEIWRSVEDTQSPSPGKSFHLFSTKLPLPVQRIRISPSGTLFIALARRDLSDFPIYALLQKVEMNGEPPFEIRKVEAISDGFRFHFTHPTRGTPNTRLSWVKRALIQSARSPLTVLNQGDVELSQMKFEEDSLHIDIPLTRSAPPGLYELTWTNLSTPQGTPLLHPTSYYQQ